MPIQVFPAIRQIYELETVMDYAVSFENLKPQDCPLDLTLQVKCDGVFCYDSPSPFIDILFVKEGFYSLEIFSGDEQTVGYHEIQIQAIDLQRGFQTEVITE